MPLCPSQLTSHELQAQNEYTRLHLDIFDQGTGDYKGSSDTIIERARYDPYTALFYLAWIETGLTARP